MRLLDAAHIVSDGHETLGQPIVPNGLPLSKIHHAAFDAHLLGVLARRAAAYDDNVVVTAHTGSGFPACSLTMYSAYQSDQFASRWPVRFSCSPCAASARRNAAGASK